jgi:hypothetical protein
MPDQRDVVVRRATDDDLDTLMVSAAGGRWPDNEPVHRLYERFGFVQEGYLRRHHPRRSGEIWDAVVMGLVLDRSVGRVRRIRPGGDAPSSAGMIEG